MQANFTDNANWFAPFAIVAWPMVAFILYRIRPLNQATLWTILGGQLLLPAHYSIKFAGVPPFDKVTIPNLAALIGCMLVLRSPPRLWYRFGLPEVLLLMLMIGPFITAELNTDPIVYRAIVLPPETHYDALSHVVGQLIFLIPFFLGRQLLRNSEDQEQVLRVLVAAGLIYSLPILFEIRMSPQLHSWVYGYFPHDWAQQIRFGGFRPVVFLGHGLAVAFFIMMTTVAAAAFWRVHAKVQVVRFWTWKRTKILLVPANGATLYLSFILVLCKSLASLVYGAVLVPMVRFAKPQSQARLAMVLAVIVFSYPLLRSADLFPTETMLDVARMVDAERAASLKYRFDQDQSLLEHASRRIVFGWGQFGRYRMYDEESGKDVSVTDGRWIITLGAYGLFGFVAEFGLLALTVFRAASALKFMGSARDQVFLAALTIIIAINMVALLPDASLTAWTWLLAGSLLGRAEAVHRARWLPSSVLASNKYRAQPTRI